MEKWVPWAKKPSFEMRTVGSYVKGHPVGCVVHFTAGNSLADAGFNSMQWGKNQGFAFMLIDRHGVLWQAHPLDRWGYHAGLSKWEGFEGGVSDDLVGIEIASAGQLRLRDGKWYPWFAFDDENRLTHPEYAMPVSELRFDHDGIAWHAYTEAQEATLLKLLVWLAKNDEAFRPHFILGHDEVAPRRKNDPGYALSMRMSELRTKVAELFGQSGSQKPQATWFELHRLDQRGEICTGIVAYAGATPIEYLDSKDIDALIAFRNRHPAAKNVLVAPHDKAWPGG